MKRRAFTLADALLGLIVLAVTVLLIEMTVQTLNHQTKLTLSSETDWYEAVALLEGDRYAFTLVEAGRTGLILRDRRGRLFKATADPRPIGPLALKGSSGGYIPLLIKVQSSTVAWRMLNDHEVALSLTTTDQRRHEAIVQFQPPAPSRSRTIDRDSSAERDCDGDPLQRTVPGPATADQPAIGAPVRPANPSQPDQGTPNGGRHGEKDE